MFETLRIPSFLPYFARKISLSSLEFFLSRSFFFFFFIREYLAYVMAQLIRTCTFVYICEVPSHVRYPPKFSSTRHPSREFLTRLAVGSSYHCARGSAMNHIQTSPSPSGIYCQMCDRYKFTRSDFAPCRIFTRSWSLKRTAKRLYYYYCEIY